VSCAHFRHVLALLDDREQDMWAVLERAVELAESERARLTLAKTTDPGRLVRWFGPLAPLCRLAPIPEPDLAAIAERRLTALAEAVPESLPVCTVLLTSNTTACLRRLAARMPYDLLVASESQLCHDLKLRRQLRRLGVSTLAVGREAIAEAGAEAIEPLGIGDPRTT